MRGVTREQLFTEAARDLSDARWKARTAARRLESAGRSDLERRAQVLESQTYKLLEDVAGAAAAELAEKKKQEMLEDEEEVQEVQALPIRRAQ